MGRLHRFKTPKTSKRGKTSLKDDINARRNRVREANKLRLSNLMAENPGKTQRWYAEQLGLAPPRVCELRKEIMADWREERLGNADALVMEELSRLDWIEKEARESFEKSRAVYQVIKRPNGSKHGATHDATTIEQPAGDPKFMEIMLKCQESRRKLLGLDAPTRLDARVHVQEQLTQAADNLARIAAEFLDEEQLCKLAQALECFEQTGKLPVEFIKETPLLGSSALSPMEAGQALPDPAELNEEARYTEPGPQ